VIVPLPDGHRHEPTQHQRSEHQPETCGYLVTGEVAQSDREHQRAGQ
jgi:hypothetical protein